MNKDTINQAVILCGGLGTRLMPLTENTPKPMVLVNGKPFLHHLLKQLSDQGVKKFLLLTGYLSEQISEYFGDGSKFGWSVDYSVGPKDWETGRRLWEAKSKIENHFLLMYSDNYSEINLDQLITTASKTTNILTLALAHKKRGNIKISSNGDLEDYDNSRPDVGYDYVEIGYMVVNKTALFEQFQYTPGHPDFNFSNLLQRIVKSGLVRGFISGGGYHSISDIKRLRLTEEFLRPKKILLIDRDGTINRKAAPGQYISIWEEFQWLESSYAAIKSLSKNGFKFIVITNQAGVDRGMIRPEELVRIHKNMTAKFAKDGVDILNVYCCTDHWEKNSARRKPGPGMFYEASKDFNIQLGNTLYIGDDERDCEAAQNAGCGMVYLINGTPAEEEIRMGRLPFIKTNNLLDKVDLINEIFLAWGCK